MRLTGRAERLASMLVLAETFHATALHAGERDRGAGALPGADPIDVGARIAASAPAAPPPRASALRFARPLALALLSLALGLPLAGAREPWVPPAAAAAIPNPFTGREADKAAKKGGKLFAERCAICHGKGGKGDGPGGVALDPRPADLTSAPVQGQKDGEIFWKLSEGRGAMPAWKLVLSETERWQLVNYVRTLAP